jgi:preprotein translocase subunit SecG
MLPPYSRNIFMGLFHFLIVVQAVVAASLVGIVLMQRSEGGGLGMGGSPSGLMSARGAADFMTRTTTILATAFILLSISLAFVAAKHGSPSAIDETLKRVEAPVNAAGTPASTEDTAAASNGKAADAKPAAPDVPLDK